MNLTLRSKLWMVLLGLSILGIVLVPAAARAQKPNILFIMSDDLNYPDIAPAYTPNLDKLLAVSTEFKGYPNFPWCNPSRASLFAGLRPEALGIYNNIPEAASVLPDRYWLPRGINDSGYYTVGVGKICHQGTPKFNVPGWDSFLYPPNSDPGISTGTVIPWGTENEVAYFDDATRLRDEAYRDSGQLLLEAAKAQDDPWFVAVGFKKPHGPWYSHRSDWEANGFLNPDGTANPDSIPDEDMDPALEVKNYTSFPPFNPLANLTSAKHFKMGYRACITHIDGLVGDLLDAVDTDLNDPNLNLPADLAIIFTSDHGHGTYQLGSRVFSKVHPHEAGNRMPLWIHLPGQTAHEDRTDIIVELVDLYPTILELAGNPRLTAGNLMTHGQSLVPHLSSGDWSGWNNWASTVILNSNQGKRWLRQVTPELTTYVQLWNARAGLFANQAYSWTHPTLGLLSYNADPEHWCNISQSPAHPLVQRLLAKHPAEAFAQPIGVAEGPADHLTLNFFAERGLRYTISSSPDLINWQPDEVIDGTGAQITRSYEMADPRRFYKAELWIDPIADFSFMK